VGDGRHRRLAGAAAGAVEKVSQQAHRLAGKWKAKRHDRSAKISSVAPRPPAASASAPAPRVIRSRGYAVKPMSVEDAVLLLASSPQGFVVFRHAASDAVAVLYKRPDGHLGLIEPGA